MSISATLIFSIGPIIGKALLKSLLDSHPLLKEIAPDLLDWLKEQANTEHASRTKPEQITAIGEALAARLRPIIIGARLDDNELAAVMREWMLTLSQVDAEQLVETRLVSARLARGMFTERPEATKTLSADGTALYQRLVREASLYVAAIASEFVGFNNLRDAALLQDTEKILEAVLALTTRPAEASAAFEEHYRQVVRDELNALEMFGVPRLKEAMERQQLDMAYVTVEVEERKAALNKDANQALLESLLQQPDRAAHISQNKRFNGPIDGVLARERRIVVRGEAGSGKTTLLRWLAVSVAKPDYFDNALKLWNNVIPFYIRLRTVDQSGFPTPEQYVAQVDADSAARQPTPDWAHTMLDQGRAVLLIDGIDELPEDRREAFLDRLKRLVRRYPRARYVVSSRPAATSKDNWPEWFEWADSAGFAEVMIKPMDTTAIDAFIDHWHGAYADGSPLHKRKQIAQSQQQLKRLLPQRPSLYRLAENPLLCSMICALHHDRQHHLPAERLKLYEECIDMMLEQRDPGRKIAPKDYPPLSAPQKLALLQALAYRMMRNGEVELAVERVDKEFADLLPQFSANTIDAADVRDYFVERSSMLRQPVIGKIDFRHRTFQEYFTAHHGSLMKRP